LLINRDAYPNPKPPPGDDSLALPKVGLRDEEVGPQAATIVVEGSEPKTLPNAAPGELPGTRITFTNWPVLPDDPSGMLTFAWWPFAKSADKWILQIYPDGQKIFPGLTRNSMKIVFHKEVDRPKALQSWSQNANGSWQLTATRYL